MVQTCDNGTCDMGTTRRINASGEPAVVVWSSASVEQCSHDADVAVKIFASALSDIMTCSRGSVWADVDQTHDALDAMGDYGFGGHDDAPDDYGIIAATVKRGHIGQLAALPHVGRIEVMKLAS